MSGRVGWRHAAVSLAATLVFGGAAAAVLELMPTEAGSVELTDTRVELARLYAERMHTDASSSADVEPSADFPGALAREPLDVEAARIFYPALDKKGWATCTRDCSNETPPRRRAAPGSISRHGR